MSHAKTAQVVEEIVRAEIRKAAGVQLAILRDTIAPMAATIELLRRDVDALKAQLNQQGATGGAPPDQTSEKHETSAGNSG